MLPDTFYSACRDAISEACEPILDSYAFRRLHKISFLGILSPKYSFGWHSFPSVNEPVNLFDGGTRFDHSIGVAAIALAATRQFGFSKNTQSYAMCWGLLHDVATWPLSHTGEAAFSSLFSLPSRTLRKYMILGDPVVPAIYHLDQALNAAGIDPFVLTSLFIKEQIFEDKELTMLHSLIHSPITPDTLEGMWRSGKVWNVDVPRLDVQHIVSCNLFDLYIRKEHSASYIDFWKKKSLIYREFINREDTVMYESAWSHSIRTYFDSLTLAESLEIDEEAIIETVMTRGLLPSSEVVKYKSPQVYTIKGNKRTLGETTVDNLFHYLVKSDNHGASRIPRLPSRKNI